MAGLLTTGRTRCRALLRTSRDVFRLRDDDTVEVKLCLLFEPVRRAKMLSRGIP